MNKVINYLKFISIFLIFELMLTFITSLLNLMGLNSGITTIILFVSNIILIFTLSFLNAHKLAKKGLIQGSLMGAIFILLMLLIKIILFENKLYISTLIYYAILFIVSVFAGLLGVNKKSK